MDDCFVDFFLGEFCAGVFFVALLAAAFAFFLFGDGLVRRIGDVG